MFFDGLYDEFLASTKRAETEEGRYWQDAFNEMHNDYLKMKDERDDYKWRYEQLKRLMNAGKHI